MIDQIKRAESALIVALTSEVAEGHTLAEQIEILVSQRDNARRAAEAHKAEAEELGAALERLVCADGDYYTDAPECKASVAELQDAMRAAATLLKKAKGHEGK